MKYGSHGKWSRRVKPGWGVWGGAVVGGLCDFRGIPRVDKVMRFER